MPEFSSFRDLKTWSTSHAREEALAKALQLREFGNGIEAAKILDGQDLSREAPTKRLGYGRCYYCAAKEELLKGSWSRVKQCLAKAASLGLGNWTVQRRLDLLATRTNGNLLPEPDAGWGEQYTCSCPVCSNGNASLLQAAKCRAILDEPCKPVYLSHVDELYAVGVYRWMGDEKSWNALSRMIRWLKENQGKEVCKYLAWILVDGLVEDSPQILKEADILIAVPADPERIQRRGFDNIVELCTWVEKFSVLPLERNALKKTRATEDLRNLSWSQRRAALQGSMEVVDPRNVKGAAVLLVDDVVTSGSTLNYCAELLKKAGAAKVHAAVVARSESTQASERFGARH